MARQPAETCAGGTSGMFIIWEADVVLEINSKRTCERCERSLRSQADLCYCTLSEITKKSKRVGRYNSSSSEQVCLRQEGRDTRVEECVSVWSLSPPLWRIRPAAAPVDHSVEVGHQGHRLCAFDDVSKTSVFK